MENPNQDPNQNQNSNYTENFFAILAFIIACAAIARILYLQNQNNNTDEAKDDSREEAVSTAAAPSSSVYANIPNEYYDPNYVKQFAQYLQENSIEDDTEEMPALATPKPEEQDESTAPIMIRSETLGPNPSEEAVSTEPPVLGANPISISAENLTEILREIDFLGSNLETLLTNLNDQNIQQLTVSLFEYEESPSTLQRSIGSSKSISKITIEEDGSVTVHIATFTSKLLITYNDVSRSLRMVIELNEDVVINAFIVNLLNGIDYSMEQQLPPIDYPIGGANDQEATSTFNPSALTLQGVIDYLAQHRISSPILNQMFTNIADMPDEFSVEILPRESTMMPTRSYAALSQPSSIVIEEDGTTTLAIAEEASTLQIIYDYSDSSYVRITIERDESAFGHRGVFQTILLQGINYHQITSISGQEDTFSSAGTLSEDSLITQPKFDEDDDAANNLDNETPAEPSNDGIVNPEAIYSETTTPMSKSSSLNVESEYPAIGPEHTLVSSGYPVPQGEATAVPADEPTVGPTYESSSSNPSGHAAIPPLSGVAAEHSPDGL